MSSNPSSRTVSAMNLVGHVSTMLAAVPEVSRSCSPPPRFGIGYRPETPDGSGTRESSWDSEPQQVPRMAEVTHPEPITSMIESLSNKKAFRRRSSKPFVNIRSSSDALDGPGDSSPVMAMETSDSPTVVKAHWLETAEAVRIAKAKNQFSIGTTHRRKRGAPNPKKRARVLSLLPVAESSDIEQVTGAPSSFVAGPSTSSTATLRSIPSLERELKALCVLQKSVLAQLLKARTKEVADLTALAEKENRRVLASEVALGKETALLEALAYAE
jgi:hypothetical protein